MKHFFAFCRRNRLFAALLAAELAVVCALAAGLFGAPYKLALTPGDFTNTLPDIAAADDDGLKIWNQIGYHSDDPMTFSADNIALPSGAYEVTVRYFSCQTPDAPTFNMLNAAGSLTFASERSPAAVTFDALRLDDCHRSLTTRLWVGFGARMQDLTATVTYDQGQLYIYSITLTEQPIYRAARLLCFLVLFAAAGAALLLLFAHVGERGAARRRALRLPLALAGITLLACLPLFSSYLYFGHDLEFHLQRIAAMAAELSYGQFPVRLTTTTLNGYGYASPLCYCELFLLLPALLYNLLPGLPLCGHAGDLPDCLFQLCQNHGQPSAGSAGGTALHAVRLSADLRLHPRRRRRVHGHGVFPARAAGSVRHLHQRQAPLRGLAADGAGYGGHGAEPSALL